MGTDAYSGTGCMEFCALGNLSHEENFPDISTLHHEESQGRDPCCILSWTCSVLKAGCDSSVSF